MSLRVREGALAGITALAVLAMHSPAAYADATCTENVTGLISHTNGYVYFTTDQTCPSWCQINFATPDANKEAYAMLLSANAQGKTIVFSWANLTSCSTHNPVYT